MRSTEPWPTPDRPRPTWPAAFPPIEGEYFTRTRKRIRTALAEHGVAGEIDRLTEQLLHATA